MTESDLCFPVDWSCDPEFAETLSTEVKERAERLAARALIMLTGYRVGGCPIAVRPCSPRCVPGTWLTAPVSGALPFQPYLQNGSWFNACGCRKQDCSCSTVHELVLPGPVAEVVSVNDSGELLPETAYRVDNGNRLVRLDGESWPACQNMSAAEGAENTLTVTYVRGLPIDTDGEFVAGILALEYAKACSGEDCRLPSSVTSLVRQGVTMELGEGVFPGGVTGIHEVDTWIAFWNPYRTKARAGVYSVDVPAPRRTTWMAGSSG